MCRYNKIAHHLETRCRCVGESIEMGEAAKQILIQHLDLKPIDTIRCNIEVEGDDHSSNWVVMEGDNYNYNPVSSDSISVESSFEDSTVSVSSSSSLLDLTEDASSSASYNIGSSPLPSPMGPLYQLADLMAQLPVKRGLSKYYQGKSQSFTSLASVKSVGDLAKKGYSYRMRMKSCKSYGGGLDAHRVYSPKATISKKPSSSRGPFLSSLSKKTSI